MLSYKLQQLATKVMNRDLGGRTLYPKEGSDLELMLHNQSSLFGSGPIRGTALQYDGDRHDTVTEACAGTIISNVVSSTAYFKNVVTDSIKTISSEIEEFVSRVHLENPVDEFTIEPRFLQGPIKSNLIPFGLSGYKNKTQTNLDIRTLNISFNKEEIFDNNKQIISDWFDELSIDDIDLYWSSVFGPRFTKSVVNDIVKKLSVYERMNMSLLILYGVRKFMNNPPDRVVGFSINELSMELTQIKDYFCLLLARSIRLYKAHMKSKHCIIRFDESSKTIYVHGEMYNIYLNGSGTVEALIGNAIDGNRHIRLHELQANTVKNIGVYNNFVAVSNTQEDVRRLSYMKTGLKGAISKHVNEMSETDVDMSIYKNDAIELVESLTLKDLDDIDNCILRIVAKGLYGYTDAYKFLTLMIRVSNKNPDIEPNDAAYIATITYVGEWLANQIDIEGSDAIIT